MSEHTEWAVRYRSGQLRGPWRRRATADEEIAFAARQAAHGGLDAKVFGGAQLLTRTITVSAWVATSTGHVSGPAHGSQA